MPFGLRISPFLFDLFAKALNWIIIVCLGWSIILYYLDDFFVILPLNADAEVYYYIFDLIYSQLGLVINYTKDIMGTIADFLGIELDTKLI